MHSKHSIFTIIIICFIFRPDLVKVYYHNFDWVMGISEFKEHKYLSSVDCSSNI